MNKKNILIVEDEIHLQETWEEMLIHFNYNPVITSNGFEAISKLNEQSLDAIITDLHMPIMDGYLVLDHIKNNNLNIVTVVCSGQTISEKLSTYEIAKVINKPFDMIKVIQELHLFFNDDC
ncbi:MAG: CheY-like chemotaxis protein [Salibacteraceae bacterium]|jgi:CheY-like chemotaxis protein